jgi:hypothetical protein
VHGARFLFPFEARRRFFHCTSFGLARALHYLQQAHAAEHGPASAADREAAGNLRIGRVQRQKVSVCVCCVRVCVCVFFGGGGVTATAAVGRRAEACVPGASLDMLCGEAAPLLPPPPHPSAPPPLAASPAGAHLAPPPAGQRAQGV